MNEYEYVPAHQPVFTSARQPAREHGDPLTVSQPWLLSIEQLLFG